MNNNLDLTCIPNCFPRNWTLELPDRSFYISYLRYSQDYGSDTTAIVWGQLQRFIILKGNHFENLRPFLESNSYLKAFRYAYDHKSDILPNFTDFKSLGGKKFVYPPQL